MAKGIQNIPLTVKQKEQLLALGFKEDEITNQTLIDVSLYKEALNGNVSALTSIKKMLQEKEEEKVEDKVDDITQEVEEEEKNILEKLSGLSDVQKAINQELIHQVAFQAVTLRNLADDISKNGVKEKYKNGANQWGYKDRAEVKTYNSMIKSYQSCMKQINDLISAQGIGYENDAFDEFDG